MKLKKGDNVLIIAGKDKGKTAKILKALPKELKILVEGANLKKKHVRPKREGEKGQVVAIPAPLDISNVKLICPKCGKATRVGYKTERPTGDGYPVKNRICKKCKQAI
ncbi:MAG: 50S ribosomal protein L24 [Candidatus Staskawiczbacteria bacterium]|jgi:large subunit ribosomal protein L24